nr:vitamin K-dependent gamma-carboxylase-like [Procambarus clarkii]
MRVVSEAARVREGSWAPPPPLSHHLLCEALHRLPAPLPSTALRRMEWPHHGPAAGGSTAEELRPIHQARNPAVTTQDPAGECQSNAGEPQDRAEEPRDSRNAACGSKCTEVLGFKPRELLSLTALARLLHRPCDPAALAATRVMFGVLMVLDVPQERGLGVADVKWGDPNTCRFPLLSFLTPPPLPYMVLLYGLLLLCAALMVVGWRWRAVCTTFVACYWYVFLLDKTTWNNHSYLYGLLASILLVSDPHRCWSAEVGGDGLSGASHVPLWNYTLLRAQLFLLYFLAGVKKVDLDWLSGYSMQRLAQHWVFTPFRVFLTDDNIDFFVVHLGGFALDSSLGFLLFFDASRPVGLVLGAAFHLMNAQIFSIGMFPWVCLVTLPIFCSTSWPRPFLEAFSSLLPASHTLPNPVSTSGLTPGNDGPSSAAGEQAHAQRQGEAVGGDNSEGKLLEAGAEASPDATQPIAPKFTEAGKTVADQDILRTLKRNPSCYYPGEDGCVTGQQKATTVAVLVYLCLQLCLPFSHFITKGYNTWTEGPYGYSWDMMVHSWDTLHVKVTAVTTHSGETLYLDPTTWVKSNRWTSHADMVVQYGGCVEQRLADRGLPISALHLDVWKSLNGRFQQRVFDPNVNILKAPWSPWQETRWVLPVVSELSGWRGHLRQLQESVWMANPAADAIFVADFPGLTLENFLSEDLANVTLEILQGEVLVMLPADAGVDILQAPCDDKAGADSLQASCSDDAGNWYSAEQCHTLFPSPKHSQDHSISEHHSFSNIRGKESHDSEIIKNYIQDKTKEIDKGDFQYLENLEKLQNEYVNNMAQSSRAASGENGKENSMKNHQSVVLGAGERLVLPSGSFHWVVTTSSDPSCYVYTFTNTSLLNMYQGQGADPSQASPRTGRTNAQGNVNQGSLHAEGLLSPGNSKSQLNLQLIQYKTKEGMGGRGGEDQVCAAGEEAGLTETDRGNGMKAKHFQQFLTQDPVGDLPTWQDFTNFMSWKWSTFKRSGRLLVRACWSVLSGTPMMLK